MELSPRLKALLPSTVGLFALRCRGVLTYPPPSTMKSTAYCRSQESVLQRQRYYKTDKATRARNIAAGLRADGSPRKRAFVRLDGLTEAQKKARKLEQKRDYNRQQREKFNKLGLRRDGKEWKKNA